MKIHVQTGQVWKEKLQTQRGLSQDMNDLINHEFIASQKITGLTKSWPG